MEIHNYHCNLKVFLDCCDAGSDEFVHRTVHYSNPCRRNVCCLEIEALMDDIDHICNFDWHYCLHQKVPKLDQQQEVEDHLAERTFSFSS